MRGLKAGMEEEEAAVVESVGWIKGGPGPSSMMPPACGAGKKGAQAATPDHWRFFCSVLGCGAWGVGGVNGGRRLLLRSWFLPLETL